MYNQSISNNDTNNLVVVVNLKEMLTLASFTNTIIVIICVI